MHRLTPKFNFFYKKLICYQNDLKGHLRSKVKVPNESPVMTSYLKLIVTVCLSGTVFKILAVLTICSLS